MTFLGAMSLLHTMTVDMQMIKLSQLGKHNNAILLIMIKYQYEGLQIY